MRISRIENIRWRLLQSIASSKTETRRKLLTRRLNTFDEELEEAIDAFISDDESFKPGQIFRLTINGRLYVNVVGVVDRGYLFGFRLYWPEVDEKNIVI